MTNCFHFSRILKLKCLPFLERPNRSQKTSSFSALFLYIVMMSLKVWWSYWYLVFFSNTLYFSLCSYDIVKENKMYSKNIWNFYLPSNFISLLNLLFGFVKRIGAIIQSTVVCITMMVGLGAGRSHTVRQTSGYENIYSRLMQRQGAFTDSWNQCELVRDAGTFPINYKRLML